MLLSKKRSADWITARRRASTTHNKEKQNNSLSIFVDTMVSATAAFGCMLSVGGGLRLLRKPCSSPVNDDQSGNAAWLVGSEKGLSRQHVFDVLSTNMLQGRIFSGAHRTDLVAGPVVIDEGREGISAKPSHEPVSVRRAPK